MILLSASPAGKEPHGVAGKCLGLAAEVMGGIGRSGIGNTGLTNEVGRRRLGEGSLDGFLTQSAAADFVRQTGISNAGPALRHSSHRRASS